MKNIHGFGPILSSTPSVLFEFAARTLTLYQERKGERGLLDFVDLEQFTLELLPQPAVAEVIREEFDLLVVDEFQDTNPIQLALFIGLAALVKRGAVWVGDVKQAIYGFRGSDPALMDAVLASVASERMPTLGITYRARPELVQIFNDLFIPAFARDLRLAKRRRRTAGQPVSQCCASRAAGVLGAVERPTHKVWQAQTAYQRPSGPGSGRRRCSASGQFQPDRRSRFGSIAPFANARYRHPLPDQ